MGNNPKKKAIILYTCAGAGHFKAADALYHYLEIYRPDLEVTLVDVLKKTNHFFAVSYIRGYSFLVNYAVFLWRFSFWVTSFKPLRKIVRLAAIAMTRLNSRDFIAFLCRENPDFIISTHFLPSQIACDLKNRGEINSKVTTIITDFGVHPFWLSQGTDEYIAVSDFTRLNLIREGVSSDKIKVLGIPVHPKFFTAFDKNILCVKLGLTKDKFTVLIVTGSFGIGPIEKIVDLLHDDLQLLVVCARNEALFGRLKEKNYAYAHIYGFVDNIEELMAASDIIITKPGGLTIAEILVSELPPIFIHPIQGQETENIRALAGYGVGIYAKSLKEIKDAVLDYKKNAQNLNLIRENIRKLKKSFQPKELCDVVC